MSLDNTPDVAFVVLRQSKTSLHQVKQDHVMGLGHSIIHHFNLRNSSWKGSVNAMPISSWVECERLSFRKWPLITGVTLIPCRSSAE